MKAVHKQAFQELREWCTKYQVTISRHPEYDEVWFDFVELVDNKPVIVEYCAHQNFSGKDYSVIKIAEVFSKDKTINFMEQEKE